MKIGDVIKFVNDTGTATLIELHRDYVVVKDENGFTYEVDRKEVISHNNEVDFENLEILPTIKKDDRAIRLNSKRKQIVEEIEVDLHFNQLVDYPNRYEAYEKLQIQLEHAKKSIEQNRLKTKKLILIHGKGKGVLEKEIYKLLQNTSGIKYKDANFSRYKLGAVEITYT